MAPACCLLGLSWESIHRGAPRTAHTPFLHADGVGWLGRALDAPLGHAPALASQTQRGNGVPALADHVERSVRLVWAARTPRDLSRWRSKRGAAPAALASLAERVDHAHGFCGAEQAPLGNRVGPRQPKEGAAGAALAAGPILGQRVQRPIGALQAPAALLTGLPREHEAWLPLAALAAPDLKIYGLGGLRRALSAPLGLCRPFRHRQPKPWLAQPALTLLLCGAENSVPRPVGAGVAPLCPVPAPAVPAPHGLTCSALAQPRPEIYGSRRAVGAVLAPLCLVRDTARHGPGWHSTLVAQALAPQLCAHGSFSRPVGAVETPPSRLSW
mmetsp:Transcript_38477/g.98391  ORF Transcript_38477/g.98391 Transcript_38477/m.98391 type:complete len:328 (-) Transcript_38477:331-1314(-)